MFLLGKLGDSAESEVIGRDEMTAGRGAGVTKATGEKQELLPPWDSLKQFSKIHFENHSSLYTKGSFPLFCSIPSAQPLCDLPPDQ